LFILIYFN